eukprot:TRINITY_DN2855_c0_g1_i3.p1 TRINITY_DN2855_c0_g1~~TRINITY_DN2855_c0_g1_i3.p1  ORF type:complete len:562 (+),score=145.65 TRINITY_DN2855_c0_g1_i3:122-1807(+)
MYQNFSNSSSIENFSALTDSTLPDYNLDSGKPIKLTIIHAWFNKKKEVIEAYPTDKIWQVKERIPDNPGFYPSKQQKLYIMSKNGRYGITKKHLAEERELGYFLSHPSTRHQMKFLFLEPYVNWKWKLQQLRAMVNEDNEQWDHGKERDNGVLLSYIKTFFQVVCEEQLIDFSEDMQFSVFNTLLVTKGVSEEIMCMIRYDESKRSLELHQYVNKPYVRVQITKPKKNWCKNPECLIFDPEKPVEYDPAHILNENYERIVKNVPQWKGVQPNNLVTFFDGAVKGAIRRAQANFKLAVPCYFPTTSQMQILLPLYLNVHNPSNPSVVLVVGLSQAGDRYVGRTILELNMAYKDARLISGPDANWLTPQACGFGTANAQADNDIYSDVPNFANSYNGALGAFSNSSSFSSNSGSPFGERIAFGEDDPFDSAADPLADINLEEEVDKLDLEDPLDFGEVEPLSSQPSGEESVFSAPHFAFSGFDASLMNTNGKASFRKTYYSSPAVAPPTAVGINGDAKTARRQQNAFHHDASPFNDVSSSFYSTSAPTPSGTATNRAGPSSRG